jgi:hydroxyisourate hydrolase
MSTVSTHVLDTSRGRPAQRVHVTLSTYDRATGNTTQIGQGTTDADGRVAALVADVQPGTYCVSFATAEYFEDNNLIGFYPRVDIFFEIRAADQHYHVPLLLNPYGYSTYRGS